jgi:sialate O-acetylesterase
MCSGQSNMDFSLAKATGGPAAAQKAGEFPQIRLFNMTSAPTGAGKYDEATLRNLAQEESGVGSWQVASPEAAGEISAIAWWMAVELQQKEGVPVGIVENAVGGSPTEAWIPRETLESRPDYRPLLAENWLECEKLSAWARSRARQNLGSHLQANHPFRPGFLFESQVRPWVNFPFDGICWYQGETNAEINDAAWHRRVLSDFIGGWRKAAQRPTLPFYMVQLPRIGGKDPLRKFWPEYRQVQATVVKSLAGVHLVVTEDLGYDSPDVHPPDKRPVAQRLASGIQNAQEQRAEKRSE